MSTEQHPVTIDGNGSTEGNTLLFAFAQEVLDVQAGRTRTQWHYVQLRYKPQDFTLRDWADVEQLLGSAPLWAKVALGVRSVGSIKPAEDWDAATDPAGRWQPARFTEYRDFLAQLLECFATTKTRPLLRGLRIAEDSSFEECELLADHCAAVLAAFYKAHEPQMRNAFAYRGEQYVIQYDEQLYGKFLTWGEATEALQIQEQYAGTAQEERTAEVFMQTSAHIVAAFARRVVRTDKKTGAFVCERKPQSLEAWGEHLAQRRTLFEDLPMDVVLDVGFFLTVSYIKQKPTLSTAWHLQNTLAAFNKKVAQVKAAAVQGEEVA